MVDIIVDQKPMEKLPYDPNDIPKVVRDRVAAVEALYRGSDGTQPSGEPEPPQPIPAEPSAVQVPASQVEAPPTLAPSAPAVAPPSPDDSDPNSNTWKSRALSKEGRDRAELDQAHRDLGELQEKYYNEVVKSQQPQRRTAPKAPTPKYLTQEDEQNYGRDLIDVAQRAAMETVVPHLQTLEHKNEELRRQLAKEQRRQLDNAVEMAVPDYREIDRNPRWHRWLLGIDVLSGRVRQTLLNEAISVGNAPRVVSFFKSFLSEEVATGHVVESAPSSQPAPAPREPAISLTSLAAPGRARPATGGNASLPADKPTYTRAQVKQLYEQHRKGAYVGREAEWARLEADFFTAQREGRYRS
jgi:hypothetical protein